MAVEEKLLEELTKIREILEPKPEPVVEKPKGIKARVIGFKDDFVEFLKQYKVMGLAVAFIMALYLGELVKALVDGLIMPILNLLGVQGKIADWVVADYFLIGQFLSALITFLIVALVIFLLVKITKKIGIE